jgi:hypothetical protein
MKAVLSKKETQAMLGSFMREHLFQDLLSLG